MVPGFERRRAAEDPEVQARRMPDDGVLVVRADLEDPVVPRVASHVERQLRGHRRVGHRRAHRHRLQRTGGAPDVALVHQGESAVGALRVEGRGPVAVGLRGPWQPGDLVPLALEAREVDVRRHVERRIGAAGGGRARERRDERQPPDRGKNARSLHEPGHTTGRAGRLCRSRELCDRVADRSLADNLGPRPGRGGRRGGLEARTALQGVIALRIHASGARSS